MAAARAPWAEADQIHHALIERADALMGCTEGSEEERELVTLTAMIEVYEQARWPAGKIEGGKG